MCNQTLWNQQSNDHFPFPIIINGPGKARTLCHVPTSVRRGEEEEGDIHNFLCKQMTCVIGSQEICSNISFLHGLLLIPTTVM